MKSAYFFIIALTLAVGLIGFNIGWELGWRKGGSHALIVIKDMLDKQVGNYDTTTSAYLIDRDTVHYYINAKYRGEK